MPRKNLVIIGSSSGIGKEISNNLKTGTEYNVICGSHSQKEGFTHIDLTNRESITRFVTELTSINKNFMIDVLILNSGIASSNAILNTDAMELDRVISINTINQFILINEIAPLLKQNSKVLFVNSKSALLTLPFLGLYAATKKANHAIADALRYELRPQNISVISLFIGNTQTKMWTEKFDNEKLITIKNNEYKEQIMKAFALGRKKYASAMTTKTVANKIISILAKGKPKNNYYIGKDTKMFYLLKYFLPEGFTNNLVKKKYGF